MEDKRGMIRVIRNPEGVFELDDTGRKNGRGAYLCRKAECLQAACKRKGLERSFKTVIPEEVYQRLQEEFQSLDAK
jgi:predicted RNA-binding protein YlxR (DUF448 family)